MVKRVCPANGRLVVRILTAKDLSRKTGSDSPTTNRSVISASVRGPREMTMKKRCPCHSRCGMLKNPNCSMAMSAEHRSKFAALHQ